MKIVYNKYHQAFFVATKYDLRILQSSNGIVLKVLDQLVDHENGVEIIDIDFDDTNRKFYLSDTSVIFWVKSIGSIKMLQLWKYFTYKR